MTARLHIVTEQALSVLALVLALVLMVPAPVMPVMAAPAPERAVPAVGMFGTTDGSWPPPGFSRVPVIRAYIGPGSKPTSWSSGELGNAVARSTKAIWISWKVDDPVWLDKLLDNAPADRTIIATYNHEPENDSPADPAGYRAAWARALPVIHAHGDLAATALLGHLSNAQNDPFWIPGVDICGFDRYNPGLGHAKSYADPAKVFSRVISYCRAKGKPLGIAETGTIVINGNAQGRANWAAGSRAVLKNAGVTYATWWSQSKMSFDAATAKAWSGSGWQR